MSLLPIDDIIPDLIEALDHHGAVVVQAPPGAGKTTRIPLALLDRCRAAGKGIVMLEPRRLAAINAARWMATTLGETVGNTIGYSIRFERRISRSTRVEVVTEGILARRIQSDPFLQGVGLVIFDEFHERSLNSDLALALTLDVQRGGREDLKILVMSATLDGEPVSRLLGNAPIITSTGRAYPVVVHYLDREPDGPIAVVTANEVKRIVKKTTGDLLVFLPGAGEIHACQRLLAHDPALKDVVVRPLFSDLPYRAQEAAILPGPQRKVVLATSIAETSLTIEGVRIVVDGGWQRRQRYQPASSLDRTETVRVSSAAADQRAGRAGRLEPGECYRLWSRHVQTTLVPFSAPEITMVDLAPLALSLALWGVNDAQQLSWLDPPSEGALSAGRAILRQLGALDANGYITPLGRGMAAMPVHPRFARMQLSARNAEERYLACDLVALLAERDIFRMRPVATLQASSSDLLDRLEALHLWRRRKTEVLADWLDQAAVAAVDRMARYCRSWQQVADGEYGADDELIGRLTAHAFPDRIACQRAPGSDRYLLASGQGAQLSPRSAVRNRPYLVALQVEQAGDGENVIYQATAIDRETLYSLFPDRLERHRLVYWENDSGWVAAREEERLGSLILRTCPLRLQDDELSAALVQGICSGPGIAVLNWTPATEQFRLRVTFLASSIPEGGWPDFSVKHLTETLADWLGPYLGGIRTRTDLAKIDLIPPLKTLLSREQMRILENEAPTHLLVPSGSRVPLQYCAEGPPVLAVKLQEMFGLAETPRLARGRVPVVLHLLSPARRPIQVTQDLRSFWNAGYGEVRKELRGRYPRHPWPDDPWNALPTGRIKKR